MGNYLIWLILIATVLLVARSGLLGPIVVGIVWLFAAAFHPDLTSNTVWFAAYTVAWVVGPQDDDN